MNTKTLGDGRASGPTRSPYRNARTKRLCRQDDPEAEALEVPVKRIHRVGRCLYRFDRSMPGGGKW